MKEKKKVVIKIEEIEDLTIVIGGMEPPPHPGDGPVACGGPVVNCYACSSGQPDDLIF